MTPPCQQTDIPPWQEGKGDSSTVLLLARIEIYVSMRAFMGVDIHNREYLKDTRRELRNVSTEEEIILWSVLRKSHLGYKFRRQHSIGRFVADFFCKQKKLVVEVDGIQHLDNIEYDQERTKYFESLGIRVIRFWNREVKDNLNGVLIKIEAELRK